MQNMSREELVSLLGDITDRVARGDSHEGKLHFVLGTDSERPFEVAAIYRIDGLLGVGRTELVGVDIATPAGKCTCGVGPYDLQGNCETCTEVAA